MPNADEDREAAKKRSERRMELAKALAHGINDVVTSKPHGVEHTDFTLLLVDQIAKQCSMVGNMQPERLIEVMKFQIEIIEKAMAEGRFRVQDITEVLH